MPKSLRLTLDIAEKFVEDSAAVDLEQFNSITNDVADALTGEEELSLNGLTDLSDAASLAEHRGALSLPKMRPRRSMGRRFGASFCRPRWVRAAL